MKINFFFIHLASALSILLLFLIPSCSAFNEDDAGMAIQLRVSFEGEIPEGALSSDSHFQVEAYARDKACKPIYHLFQSEAYAGKDWQINWVGKRRYWSGVFTKFIAYWPADANVEIDDQGNILSSDCILIAETEPYCQYSENPTLRFHSSQNRIILDLNEDSGVSE